LTFEKVLGKDIWGPLVLYWSKQNNRLYIGDAEAHAMWEYTTKLKFLFPVTENGNSKPTSLIDYAGKTFYASYPDPDRIEVVEFHSISGEAKNPATGPAQPSFPNLFTAGPSLTITAGSASGDK